MSGGSMDYLYSKVEENVAYLGDPIIMSMTLDFVKVLHDAEWAKDGDILEESYFKTLSCFKRKWLKKTKLTKSEQTQKMFDIKSLAQIGFRIADYEAGAISDRETIFRVIAGIAKAGLKDTVECEKAFNHWQESQKLKAAEEEAKGNKPYYFFK